MTTRDDLEQIAAYRRNLPDVQGETIAKARAEGMTWREIASILELTERAVYKSQRIYEERVGAR